MKRDLIRIDQAGRARLPKALRDQLGLRVGDYLEVSVRSDTIVLRPINPCPWLEEVDGLLVLKGVTWAGDVGALVATERDERVGDLLRRTLEQGT
ncbi:MAG: AbrB/MazE/SpoVT family DNA-binding domain-containing protein [Verrucomicrobiales bacterium]|nr:AbrB/MazE/SpoVT family DNA-binding domain-containing protein [Verrucomicrobiales bacterium]